MTASQRTLGLLVATVVAGAACLVATATPAVADDSLLPGFGTADYDVQHYDIDLRYRTDRSIVATTRIDAVASGTLTSFSLDLSGLDVSAVTVDGAAASWARSGHKLTVTPAVAVDGTFTTTVTYSGRPRPFTEDGGLSKDGWIRTREGATTLSEPTGSATWFPGNDTPSDKATFDVSVRAPRKLEVAGSGDLVSHKRHGSTRTWHWVQTRPMATYLAMISIGQYRLHSSTMRTTAGRTIPVWTFIDPRLGGLKRQRTALPKLIRIAESWFGPYPQTSAGMVVTLIDTGYSLETQNRPVFTWIPTDDVLLHELAHQWFGDSVTPSDWGDIWLNEGFATYAELLLYERRGVASAAEWFDAGYRTQPDRIDWTKAPAALPGSDELFDYDTVYLRGAMTLQALREAVGDDDFFAILSAWPAGHAHGNATTADFIALAEQVSGKDLDQLFTDWLYTPSRPDGY